MDTRFANGSRTMFAVRALRKAIDRGARVLLLPYAGRMRSRSTVATALMAHHRRAGADALRDLASAGR